MEVWQRFQKYKASRPPHPIPNNFQLSRCARQQLKGETGEPSTICRDSRLSIAPPVATPVPSPENSQPLRHWWTRSILSRDVGWPVSAWSLRRPNVNRIQDFSRPVESHSCQCRCLASSWRLPAPPASNRPRILMRMTLWLQKRWAFCEQF